MNGRIMIADDLVLNSRVVQAHLASYGYSKFIPVTQPIEILPTLYREEPDILLLDLMMPGISGLEILEAVRADRRFVHLPILILTATTDQELKLKALELGATDFLNKPIAAEELIPRVRNALTAKRYRDHLEDQVAERTEKLLLAQREVVHCLARAAEFRDNETGHHVIRVRMYVEIIARRLGFDPEIVQLIGDASVLHDVGKIGISDAILLKPGKLTDEEFDTMRRHCDFGYSICSHSESLSANDASHCESGISFLESYSSPLLRTAAIITATHHEKWDGSGYPKGLKGTDIPLEGRITAVADVFDALSSKRPYKDPFPLEKCLAILTEGKGSHFDPHLVDVFLSDIDEVVSVRETYADA